MYNMCMYNYNIKYATRLMRRRNRQLILFRVAGFISCRKQWKRKRADNYAQDLPRADPMGRQRKEETTVDRGDRDRCFVVHK